METTNRPPTISAQEFAIRHMRALQSLRDETLLLFDALEKAPQDELARSLRDLPQLIKSEPADFDVEYSRAKLSLATSSLRRVLQMTSLFFERIFSDEPPTIAADKSDHRQDDAAARPATPSTHQKNAIDIFREKIKQAGGSEAPAATMASLAALERLFGAQLAGSASDQGGPDQNIVLVELERSSSPDGSDHLEAKPWHQKLSKNTPSDIDRRLLNSIFVTGVIASHEALQAAAKIRAKKT